MFAPTGLYSTLTFGYSRLNTVITLSNEARSAPVQTPSKLTVPATAGLGLLSPNQKVGTTTAAPSTPISADAAYTRRRRLLRPASSAEPRGAKPFCRPSITCGARTSVFLGTDASTGSGGGTDGGDALTGASSKTR